VAEGSTRSKDYILVQSLTDRYLEHFLNNAFPFGTAIAVPTCNMKSKMFPTNKLAMLCASLCAVMLTCGVFVPHVQAVPITGQISFSGRVALNNNNPLLATAVNTWRDSVNLHIGFCNAFGVDGSFTGITGLAAMSPWTFGVVVGGARPALWSIGGFTFDLSSSTVIMRNPTDLVVTGIGVIHGGPGFDDTEGTWDFHLSNAGGRFHADFSFDSSADSVPDGGATVMLLGAALGALGMVRHYLKS
jgi:VPDSG-CTERM motif